MKLDTNTEGIEAIWKPYQILAIRHLMKQGALTTREVWEHINDNGVKISRAQVINFLATLADEGLATYEEHPGKGGMHRTYTLIDKTMKEFDSSVIDKILYKLWEMFPDNERINKALKE